MTKQVKLMNICWGVNPSGRGRSLSSCEVLVLLLSLTLLIERVRHILEILCTGGTTRHILFFRVRDAILHVLELLEVLSYLVSTTALNIRLVISLTTNLPNLLRLELVMELTKLVAGPLYIKSLPISWCLGSAKLTKDSWWPWCLLRLILLLGWYTWYVHSS